MGIVILPAVTQPGGTVNGMTSQNSFSIGVFRKLRSRLAIRTGNAQHFPNSPFCVFPCSSSFPHGGQNLLPERLGPGGAKLILALGAHPYSKCRGAGLSCDSPARWLPVPPEQRSKHAGGGKESLPPELRQILSSEITATVHKVRKCAQLENSVISEGGESHLGGHLVHG